MAAIILVKLWCHRLRRGLALDRGCLLVVHAVAARAKPVS
jgi:hypothetical protein